MTPGRGPACGGGSGGRERPLDLIHRNKVPNPVSMRVRSLLAKALGQAFNVAVKGVWYGLPSGPVKDVVLRRLVNGFLTSRKALLWELYEER